MQYSIETRIRDNPILRSSFNALAEETFGLSFEAWHQAGYWTDRYLPYVACAGGRVIANASVNLMDTVWNGNPRRFIQIGTVMTARDARGKMCIRDRATGVYFLIGIFLSALFQRYVPAEAMVCLLYTSRCV